MKKFNLLIENPCPQCGAPATLSETDRLFTCEYCRVKSYLLVSDYFRYILPDAAPQGQPLLFFPYWRLKGLLFSCISGAIRKRFIDVSQQAVGSRHFPISLGFRSQTLKLRFASPHSPGRFLQPVQSAQTVMKSIESRFNALLPGPLFHQAYIGESMSLIYSPFYVRNTLYDAVLNASIGSDPSAALESMASDDDGPQSTIAFLPALCPKCGWDLEGSRDSLVLLCRNCRSAWSPDQNKLMRIKFAHIPPAAEAENVVYLPFWRIKTEITGIELNTYADLVKIANLPKVVKNHWHDLSFHFWSPAFKIRPQTFLSLCSKMTLSEPAQPRHGEVPAANLYPVNLPITEAVESVKINLASFMKPQRVLLPRLQEIRIRARSYLLVFVAFVEKHHELIRPRVPLTIPRAHLRLARNL